MTTETRHPALTGDDTDSRYTVNDNWGDTREAISEFMRGFTQQMPDDERVEYLSKVQPTAFLNDVRECGFEFPFRYIELVRWLDEADLSTF